MKIGDLVKPKQRYSKNEIGIGIVINVKEGFFKTYNDYFEDRLTIYWAHGETTTEPNSYVKVVSDKKK